MLNLLIAVMGDTFTEIKENEKAAAMFEQAETIVEYERLLIFIGVWDPQDKNKFPRYMVFAEEAETEHEETAESMMHQHVIASSDAISKRVDALEKDTKRMLAAHITAVETKLTEQHEETKAMLGALMSRLGEHGGVVIADVAP
eukprot:COSAG06_NODE_2001_length_7869_cov_25.334363_5_plen_144_part_00